MPWNPRDHPREPRTGRFRKAAGALRLSTARQSLDETRAEAIRRPGRGWMFTFEEFQLAKPGESREQLHERLRREVRSDKYRARTVRDRNLDFDERTRSYRAGQDEETGAPFFVSGRRRLSGFRGGAAMVQRLRNPRSGARSVRAFQMVARRLRG